MRAAWWIGSTRSRLADLVAGCRHTDEGRHTGIGSTRSRLAGLVTGCRHSGAARPRYLAEEEGFEPPWPCGPSAFKAAPIVHSGTPPQAMRLRRQLIPVRYSSVPRHDAGLEPREFCGGGHQYLSTWISAGEVGVCSLKPSRPSIRTMSSIMAGAPHRKTWLFAGVGSNPHAAATTRLCQRS